MFPFRFTTRRAFQLLGLALLGILSGAAVQGQRPDERLRDPRPISEEEARERIEHFRNQRLRGDYCFRFELEHIPARGDARLWLGTMWGSWNHLGPVTRVRIRPHPRNADAAEASELELIVQNGEQPRAWRRTGGDGPFAEIEGSALFDPLISGLNYSAFDLQMPFVYWDDFEYDGVARAQGRQHFLMYPPAESIAASVGVDAVRIELDDQYNALRSVDVLDEDGAPLSTFSVVSFKQVQKQWIVKVIDLLDRATRDRTRFKVTAARLELSFDRAIFDPRGIQEAPAFKPNQFTDL